MPRCTSQWEDYKFQGPLWTPETDTDCQFYYDLKDLAYTKQNTAQIHTIYDKSRWKRHITDGASGISIQVAGKPTRPDDGTQMYTGGIGFHATQFSSGMSPTPTNYVISAACNETSSINGHHLVALQSSTDANTLILFDSGQTYVRNSIASGPTFGGINATDPAPTFNNWMIISCTWNGTDVNFYKNGKLAATSVIGGTVVNVDRLSVDIDWADNLPQAFIGGWAGICMFTNINKREIIEGHLAWRYGLNQKLIFGHKYASAPPIRGNAY